MANAMTGPRVVEGSLQIKGRIGFVLAEDPVRGDVLIDGPTLRLAMDGDRVRAEVTSVPAGGRRLGRITAVLSRAHSEIVGAYGRFQGQSVLWLENESAPVKLEVPSSMAPGEGELVVAKITRWPTLELPAAARATAVLGPRSAPGVELQALIYKHGLPRAFSTEVEAEAARYGEDVPASAYADRQTLFDQTVFTIDGADAKDFDDAVSIRAWPHGHPENHAVRWRLGVHIADVAHYVTENSALDHEAFERGTSVYLSGTVIPMLPFSLSDGLCSLRPERVRLTLSCELDIDAQGRVIAERFFESAIRSARRFTYEQVESVLKGQPVGGIIPELQRDLLEMDRLAKLLRRVRFGRGSLDFDFPEAYVQSDPQGRPLDIRKRERLESHRLIEDFMLVANEAVARRFQKDPFLYRIHEKPDPLKLAKLRQTLEAVGIAAPRGLESGDSSALQQVLRATDGKPLQAMVHTAVLRSLKQAAYSPINRGHFGLASQCYTHFTSPIRRYPDLVVHRIFKEHLHRSFRAAHWKFSLPKIAEHSSQRERIAVGAEREYLDVQRVRLMEPRVGETFEGVITGVTAFGFFVQLNEFFVEGLVHISTLPGDFYLFDELRMLLRGKRTGRRFAMGQTVKVLLAAANPTKRQLDFQWIAPDAAPAAPRGKRNVSGRDAHKQRAKVPQHRRKR